MTLRIVKTGTWLYDGTIERPVDIIALDFDWWYEMAKADGILDADEAPMKLGHEGYLYYVRYQRAAETTEPTWVDSPGHQEVEQAMHFAEKKVIGGITWNENTDESAVK